MAASRAQQVGIWTIAIVLFVGTIGSFLILVLQNDNAAKDTATSQSDLAAQIAEQTKAANEQAKTNADSSEGFDGYTAEEFDAASATALKKEILVAGTGDEVKSSDSIKSSYFGWTSDGKIFDSSKKKGADDAPVTFPLSGVIKGWTDGLAGQRVGSVVKLTIPADQAYGSTGSGVIPADAPLQFIVKIESIENTSAQ